MTTAVPGLGHPRRPPGPQAIALLAAACFSMAVGGQEPAAPVEPPADTAPQEHYGRTPDTVIPFRHFRHPYLRFFQEPVEFRGTGRVDASPAAPASVRIGFFGPAGSAPDADLGQHMLDGVTLAIEQANAGGGCDGLPFELIPRQDLGKWGASSNEMVAFKTVDDVLAVIGSIDGANTHIALRVALKTQMPIVNTATTDPTLTETRIPWIIRCMADDRQQGYALADHIFTTCQLERIVALRVNDRYGRTGIAEFRDAARRLKHPLRAELRWDRGERDFDVQLERIAQLDPQAIVLWGNAADTAAIVREIRRRGLTWRIFGCDRMASSAFLDAAGDAAEGVVAAASWNPQRADDRLREFRTAFIERFHRPPNAFSAHAYDGANILIDAIRSAGLNRVRIRDALAALQTYEGVTGLIRFDTTHNDIGPVYLATVADGRFTYEQVDFGATPVTTAPRPYRTISQSPPAARSPARRPRDAGSALSIACFLPMDETGAEVVRGIRAALAEDAQSHPNLPPIELLICDARGRWGQSAAELADLVVTGRPLAVIGSTERRGTHLAEMIAAKVHLPVVSLCASDPTINQIPLPWIFSIAPKAGPDGALAADLGYDAASVVLSRIRAGANERRTLRDALASRAWSSGRTGTFRFDELGRRVEPGVGGTVVAAPQETGITDPRVRARGGER